MVNILTPLMDRLSLTRKFAVVGMLFAVSTAFLTYMLYTAAQGNIEFAKQERLGVTYLAKLPDLLEKAQQFRDIHNRLAAGDKSAQPSSARSSLEQTLAAVQTVDQLYGADLKVSANFKAIQNDWQSLRDAPANPESSLRADKFVDAIVDFIGNVCDSSNLSLDPDLDSYSVMLATCADLPKLIRHQGKQRDVAGIALRLGHLEQSQRDNLVELRPLAKDAVDSADENLKKSFAANEVTKAALESGLGNVEKALASMTQSLTSQVLGASLAGNADDLVKQSSEAIGLSLQLTESSRKELDRLLQLRIDKFSSERNGYLGLALAVLVIVVLLFVAMYRSIVGQLREALSVAEAVAAGDLTRTIKTDRNDELGQLMKALKSMNDGLVQIVGDIRASVETINTASQEIAVGNVDLSQRTEEQAASLEETAASMEELTSTVKQNADNAREANQVAESASDIAQKGGAAVGAVVATMAEINDSSKKIVDIIGVIDGIAFQTNILALNAAVEAARAGEQGRGFAVVAGEVRSLAQRSAAAAKEIKTLISDSVNRVTEGTAQVDRAGVTMDEVVSSINKVSDIMASISAASSEQSAGIEQVNTAITQMEEVTQQNAALVEEAAAAAGSMQDQARLLMEAVNRFKLDNVKPTALAAPVRGRAVHRPAGKPASSGRKPVTGAGRPAGGAKPPAVVRKHDDEDWSEF